MPKQRIHILALSKRSGGIMVFSIRGNGTAVSVAATRYWLVALGLLTPLMMVVTWPVNYQLTHWQAFIRYYWLFGTLFEIVFLFWAARRGWSPLQQLNSAHVRSKILIGLWLSALVFSTMLSDADKLAAIMATLFWMIHILFFSACLNIWRVQRDGGLTEGQLEPLLCSLAIGGCLIGTILLIYTIPIDGSVNAQWQFTLPGFSNIRHPAYLLTASTVAAATGLVSSHNLRTKAGYAVAFIFCFAFLMWSGSRAGAVAVIAALVLIIVFACYKRFQIFLILVAASSLSAAVSITLPLPPDPAFGLFRRLDLANTGQWKDVSSGRLTLWREAVEMIPEKPLLGHGAHQYRSISKAAKGQLNHPHDFILQFLFDWGIVGAFPLIALLGSVVIGGLVKHARLRMPPPPTTAILVAMTTLALVDGAFFYSIPLALVAILLAYEQAKREDSTA